MNGKTILCAAMGALIVSGCGAKRSAEYAPTLPPPVYATSSPANGAIFQADAGYAPLYHGERARRVGDLLTIVLVERVRSSKSTSSSTSRDGSIDVAPPAVGPFSFNPDSLNSGSGSSFTGQGSADQSSSLRGDITVTIAEVRPNGTAFVRGEKLMQLSQGEEWVQVSGIVRFADIDQDNRIASTRLADARIVYSGRGSVQQASRSGWLLRFFNVVSPF
ncbi:flagellar basal body L-ring protein FlgH [Sphingomicrobium astaxanthinifaciens]|uniref:flagellar basal body L-ring protein FlgH n=1 Tax=Sphingomicrobium astaxanthinifaciens TaxID=1227949 RepID=UPI001FCC512E|nr:flagellar basal body L-ring protein FlgH [Sphingomicrobium astaxanthinifaciens]MCJ7420377.1 flagellar basal body L-ring protein FlgH [Sphingomicrobium astaxanthinifaciens]